MSTSAQKICIEVLSLPRKSRAEIAERILLEITEAKYVSGYKIRLT